MPILTENKDIKLMCSDHKVAKIYCQNEVIYSSGNIVTYHVSPGVTYQEEVDEGASCLSPKTFTPSLSGWTFVGWRSDASANANVHQSLVMGDNPVVLYAVFRQAVTVTYYNGSTEASSTSGYRYYNSGNVANPSFTLTQAALSGWTARGWSTSAAANGGITYANGAAFTRDSNITLYGMYQQTIALTTVANGSSSTQYGTRYYNSNGNSINPVFTVSTPSLSGANWLGWCNSAGTVLYSSISNLALSASTTLYSKFKYADSSFTMYFTDASAPGATTKAHSQVLSSPVINGTIYERATIYTNPHPTGPSGAVVYVTHPDDSSLSTHWGAGNAFYEIKNSGASSGEVITAYCSLEAGRRKDGYFGNTTVSLTIPNSSGLYLYLGVNQTLGTYGVRGYIGNSMSSAGTCTLTGRTVIG